MAVKPGMAGDVTTIQLEKYNDFKLAFEVSKEIEKRISQAFLLAGSVTRDGERVTAKEIQYMINELEDSLGGIYSILSQEFQLPLIRV